MREQLSKDNLRLTASACDHCQITWHPPRLRCPRCLTQPLTDVTLGETGVLYSYTVVRIGRSGEEVPYALAVADFDSVRVFARLDNWEIAEIGGKVSVISTEVQSEHERPLEVSNFNYKFRPVNDEGK